MGTESFEYCDGPKRWAIKKVPNAAEYLFSQQPNRLSHADIADCKNTHQIAAEFPEINTGFVVKLKLILSVIYNI